MSTSEIIAAVLALLSLVGGVVGKYIIDGLKERIERLEATNNSAVLQSRVDSTSKTIEALWDQVGRSSEEGMRKTVHDSRNLVTRALLTCEEHERLLADLRRRVFNGRHRETER